MHIFWFRRDLRLNDNTGLAAALKGGQPVQPIFIFDPEILKHLHDPQDARVSFIWDTLEALKVQLNGHGADLWVLYGEPERIFTELLSKHKITHLGFNHDYEPKSISRDQKITRLATAHGVIVESHKDQVIFEKNEVLTDSKTPYSVFTPYKRKWLSQLTPQHLQLAPKINWARFHQSDPRKSPSLKDMGFEQNITIKIPAGKPDPQVLKNYGKTRDIPALDTTSRLGLHLRFGTVSVREMVKVAQQTDPIWLSELIWREFFMQILFHFPRVENKSFRPEYDNIEWLNQQPDFEKWKVGQTGYPLVDAGMRELNATGFMHNRVRMVVASFLCKHLLTQWQKGERYFAEKLLDYELSANSGNWQWAAGSGCDAAPYFRVFNPEIQLKKFDPNFEYVRKWVPEFGTEKYPQPMIDHATGRDRALRTYTKTLKGKRGGSVE